jgi:hypothetical protein
MGCYEQLLEHSNVVLAALLLLIARGLPKLFVASPQPMVRIAKGLRLSLLPEVSYTLLEPCQILV